MKIQSSRLDEGKNGTIYGNLYKSKPMSALILVTKEGILEILRPRYYHSSADASTRARIRSLATLS